MAEADLAVERLKALLKVNSDEGSVYVHLGRVIRALVMSGHQDDEDVLEQFEAVSMRVKKASYRGPPAPDQVHHLVPDPAEEEQRLIWSRRALALVRPPSDPLSAPRAVVAVQDFQQDAAMLEWAGVGFGKPERFQISMSLRRLAGETEGLESLRLWGKVLCREGDLYIAEGVLQMPSPLVSPASPPLPGSPDDDVEPRGQGANAWTYWVCSEALSAPWKQLPAARASAIVAARKFKKLLYGRLDAVVDSVPPFAGKEITLLRSQIARIQASCCLAPRGFYEVDEDAVPGPAPLRPVVDFQPQEPEMQGSIEGYVHSSACLLSNGKSSWPDLDRLKEGALSEQATAAIEARKAQEPAKSLFEGAAGDLEEMKTGDCVGSPAWKLKVFGDRGASALPFGGPQKTHLMAALFSTIWPGAVTVARNGRFVNLYVGDGVKSGLLLGGCKDNFRPLRGTLAFSSGNAVDPMAPAEVQDEPIDIEEQAEPQPVRPSASGVSGGLDEGPVSEDAES